MKLRIGVRFFDLRYRVLSWRRIVDLDLKRHRIGLGVVGGKVSRFSSHGVLSTLSDFELGLSVNLTFHRAKFYQHERQVTSFSRWKNRRSIV